MLCTNVNFIWKRGGSDVGKPQTPYDSRILTLLKTNPGILGNVCYKRGQAIVVGGSHNVLADIFTIFPHVKYSREPCQPTVSPTEGVRPPSPVPKGVFFFSYAFHTAIHTCIYIYIYIYIHTYSLPMLTHVYTYKLYLYKYTYSYRNLLFLFFYLLKSANLPMAWWLECSPMAWETWVQSQVESYQRLKKWYLILPCTIRYGSRIK